MESCKTCALYSEHYDNFYQDFNDVGDVNDHFCPMYQAGIPDGIFEDKKDCEYYERGSDHVL